MTNTAHIQKTEFQRSAAQRGFTLIELVIVITILGILAALALPRFAALQTDARIAKMNAAAGSLKAAAAIAHSIQLTQQLATNSPVTMDGNAVTMNNGYPDSTLASIGYAAGLATSAGVALPDYVITNTATVLTVTPDSGHASCSVAYTIPAGAGQTPTYNSAALTIANC